MSIALLVCLVGLLLWHQTYSPKASATGAVMFSWGLLVWLLQGASLAFGPPRLP